MQTTGSDKQPAISVIVVTYNRAATLEKTLSALRDQSETDFELIIADDASTDATPDICAAFASSDPRVKYARRQRNLGMPENLNSAIRSARGEFIAILHDDDLYCPELLEKWVTTLRRYPDAAFVFNSYNRLDRNDRVATISREELPECIPGSVLLEKVFFRRGHFGSPVWGTVMLRRAVLSAVGLFDSRFGFWADVNHWMRLAENFSVAYIDEALISVRNPEASPHQFDDRLQVERAAVRRAFWEARIRHFRTRPVRMIAEAVRHGLFVATDNAYIMALDGWHYFKHIYNGIRRYDNHN